jgi:hypothetical protein
MITTFRSSTLAVIVTHALQPFQRGAIPARYRTWLANESNEQPSRSTTQSTIRS